MAARMEEAQASLKVLMDMTEEGHVYWAERSGPDGRNMSVCSAPVEVGDILRERLFSAGRSAILTSATLGTGDADMSYFAGRVGAESVRKLQIGSPFNYREQEIVTRRQNPLPQRLALTSSMRKFCRNGLKGIWRSPAAGLSCCLPAIV